MEFGRVGYLPSALGRVHPRRQTPVNALIATMVVGFGALLTGKTGEIITLAVFGALTLYILSMLSLLKLRRDQPDLERPYRTPWYPVTPVVALSLAIICLAAVTYSSPLIGLIFFALMLSGALIGNFVGHKEVE